MTTLQKVIGVLGIAFLIYFFFANTIGDDFSFVRVKYADRIVEVQYKTEEEYHSIIRRSNNDCLFFDGEYFFDEPPTLSLRPILKTKVIDNDSRVINGDYTIERFIGTIIGIIIATVILLVMVIPSSGDYHDYY